MAAYPPRFTLGLGVQAPPPLSPASRPRLVCVCGALTFLCLAEVHDSLPCDPIKRSPHPIKHLCLAAGVALVAQLWRCILPLLSVASPLPRCLLALPRPLAGLMGKLSGVDVDVKPATRPPSPSSSAFGPFD
jgi:hypothetical protein